MTAKSKTKDLCYPTLKVFAAAVAAYDHNGGYYKEARYVVSEAPVKEEKIIRRNLDIMRELLDSKQELLTEANYELAKRIMEYYQGKLFDMMAGSLNSYSKAACAIAGTEEVKSLVDVGLIASLPKAYRDSVKFDTELDYKERAIANSVAFGKVGDSYHGKAMVVSSVYSRKWFRHFHMVQDLETKNVLNFSSDEKLEVGAEISIRGRIKDHTDGKVTRLNYVRIDKNLQG